MGIDRGFNSATNRCEFGFNLASKLPRFSPRSRHDRGPDPSSIACRSIGDDSPRKELRSRLDRTAIVGSSTSCMRRPMALQVSGWPRSRDRVDSGFEERPPSDGRRSR